MGASRRYTQMSTGWRPTAPWVIKLGKPSTEKDWVKLGLGFNTEWKWGKASEHRNIEIQAKGLSKETQSKLTSRWGRKESSSWIHLILFPTVWEKTKDYFLCRPPQMVFYCDRMTGPCLEPSARAPEWPPWENGSRKNEGEMLHRKWNPKALGARKVRGATQ